MSRDAGGGVLPFVLLLAVTAVCGLLALVGYVIDRAPVMPGAVPRGYQRVMFAVIFGLARPFDAWTERPRDTVAGRVPGESAP